MATRGDRCASRYGRRSILGPLFGLALTPLLVGAARAEDEVETTDAVTMPPQPGDHFVFLSGPNKGQVVRPDNLTVGGPQVQVFPAGPDGIIRNGTPLNLVILARFDPADLSEETRARRLDLLLPRLGLRSEEWRRGAGWAGAAALAVTRRQDCGRRCGGSVRLF
jgi:hypothetical protein